MYSAMYTQMIAQCFFCAFARKFMKTRALLEIFLNKEIKILVVDDHRLFAAGMSTVLQKLASPVAVKEIHNGMQALNELERVGGYDLVLADIEMPSVSGVDLLLALQARGNSTPIIILSASEHEREIERAMSAGARGYIPKRTAPETILMAVEKVLRGEIFYPDGLDLRTRSSSSSQKRQADVPPTGSSSSNKALKFSSRQLEILDLMESGKTNKQIAEVLGVSQSTVKFHIAGLFRELNVRTRTECVHIARQLNIGGLAT